MHTFTRIIIVIRRPFLQIIHSVHNDEDIDFFRCNFQLKLSKIRYIIVQICVKIKLCLKNLCDAKKEFIVEKKPQLNIVKEVNFYIFTTKKFEEQKLYWCFRN